MKDLAFEKRLKIHCKIKRIKFKDIALHIGITSQELHNILNGFQASVPSKGIDNVEQIKQRIRKYLSLKF